MESLISVPVYVALVAVVLSFAVYYLITTRTKARNSNYNLPPGSFGWPFLGETLEFLRAAREGKPERFVKERVEKYNSTVFKTSLSGQPTAVFCGPNANKFLFTNENKFVVIRWPRHLPRLFGRCLVTTIGDDARVVRKMITNFLSYDSLMQYVRTLDVVTDQHFKTHWEGKEELKAYPTVKFFIFELACRLFMSLEDPQLISKLCGLMLALTHSQNYIAINIPGTTFNRALKAGTAIRKELQPIVKQRKVALEQKIASPSQDLLSHLLVTADENGRFLSEEEIINNLIAMLCAGHDTTTATVSMIIQYLAKFPQVREKVLKEQLDIASSKGPGEKLQWEDILKMRYSWNVVCEVLRISPPLSGSYRQSIQDFTYEGYTIPKGWKIYFSVVTTHRDPNLYPNGEMFDETRFEGASLTPFQYIPFGGGPRMCLGKDTARPQILVFLHHFVKRFKWDLLIPDETFDFVLSATPVKDLPIRLQPLNCKA